MSSWLISAIILRMKEVSVVLPCLNEEASIGGAITEILTTFSKHNVDGEVIVVDNGSTDTTAEIAKQFPVVLVNEPNRGYGNAYQAGFNQASGTYLIMGDPDASYDFTEIPKFLDLLQEYDFVLGSRFAGDMESGAMPWLHRYVGNPGILLLMRLLYGLKLTEPSTGFVGMRSAIVPSLKLKESGMEFSSEVIVRVKQGKYRMHEIPINYRVRKGTSKLRTFRDGARHLWFLLKAKWV